MNKLVLYTELRLMNTLDTEKSDANEEFTDVSEII